jgi:hypothetical protein
MWGGHFIWSSSTCLVLFCYWGTWLCFLLFIVEKQSSSRMFVSSLVYLKVKRDINNVRKQKKLHKNFTISIKKTYLFNMYYIHITCVCKNMSLWKKIHIIFIIKSLNGKFVNNHTKIGSSKKLNLPWNSQVLFSENNNWTQNQERKTLNLEMMIFLK